MKTDALNQFLNNAGDFILKVIGCGKFITKRRNENTAEITQSTNVKKEIDTSNNVEARIRAEKAASTYGSTPNYLPSA